MSRTTKLAPANANLAKRDYNQARYAGGMTDTELAHKRIWDPANAGLWRDDMTNLWVPNAVVLFRPWYRPTPTIEVEPVKEAYPKRDAMQLED